MFTNLEDCGCTPECPALTEAGPTGPAGADGVAGSAGTNGENAYTTTTAQYTQPAVNATVTVSVATSTWASIGQNIYIRSGGYYEVIDKPSSFSLTVENLGATGNATVGATIATTRTVTPAGPEGPAVVAPVSIANGGTGEATKTAAFDALAPTTTKGDLIVSNGSDNIRVAVGTDNYSLIADAAQTSGVKWAQVPLTSGVTGALPIANGGTGQITKTPAFDALSPTTTKGDLIAYDGTDNVRVAAGTDGFALIANSGATPGINWRALLGSDIKNPQVLGKLTTANFNVTTDQSITIYSSRYVIRKIVVLNASTSLTTAAGGLYTNAAKAGTIIVSAAQVYSALTASGKFLDLTLTATIGTDFLTATTIYFSLTTPQGGAATGDIYVIGDDLRA